MYQKQRKSREIKGLPDMPELVACLMKLRTVEAEADFEPQNWRPKLDWLAVLMLSGPHPMRILQIRNETSLKRIKQKFRQITGCSTS